METPPDQFIPIRTQTVESALFLTRLSPDSEWRPFASPTNLDEAKELKQYFDQHGDTVRIEMVTRTQTTYLYTPSPGKLLLETP